VFRFLLGINDTGAYIKAGPILFLIWSFITTIGYFYLGLPVFIAILLNSFDMVTKEQGHVSDQKKIGVLSILRNWPADAPLEEIMALQNKI
jgi:hypothetical protein